MIVDGELNNGLINEPLNEPLNEENEPLNENDISLISYLKEIQGQIRKLSLSYIYWGYQAFNGNVK